MPTPIILPDLGAGGLPVQIGCWLVEPGESVMIGEGLAEIVSPGVMFELPSPADGVVARIDRLEHSAVAPGDVLGWIEP